MNRYKCIKRWTRNEVGDIVEQWEMNRYPPEIYDHFQLIIEKPKIVKAPEQVAPKVQPSEPIQKQSTEVKVNERNSAK
jgi:hypothetical protein